MKKLFICLSALGMILIGCSKNDGNESDKPNDNNGNGQPEIPNDPNDVCSSMDDLSFISYCYENFDINKDGIISVSEADAVREIEIFGDQIKSLKGIERFPNLESLYCSSPIEEVNLQYNLKLTSFRFNQSLKKILLPNSLQTIKANTFSRCTSLTDINLPSNLVSIEARAFSGCTSLANINFPTDSRLSSIGYMAFENCTSLTEINFPAKLGVIKEKAFSGCTNLTNINFPAFSHLASIEKDAFVDSGLININFPTNAPNLTSIGREVFRNCKSLKKILFPSYIRTIEASAFCECTSLTDITFSSNSNLTSIGDWAFSGCTNLTNINLPSNLTSIGACAFYDCSSLTNISFPASLTTIWGSAFSGCTNLTNINFHHSSNLTSIYDGVFRGCSSITDISLPQNLTSIGKYAFGDCSPTNVTCYALIPPKNMVNSFMDWIGIKDLYVPIESIQAYKNSSFWNNIQNILPIE